MAYNDWVDWRLSHGSQCEACPLNGQRKVGTDGPVDADVVLIGEAPGADEEAYREGYQKYGSPFQGRSGWALKAKLLAPAGLVEVERMDDGWIKPKKLKCFIMNTIMCRPPGNKINSPEGKMAVACCSPSARALLTRLEQMNDRRSYVPLGATSISLLTGREGPTVGTFRGRVLPFSLEALHHIPEGQLKKLPVPTEAVGYLEMVKTLISKHRHYLKPEVQEKLALKALKDQEKALAKREKEETALAKKMFKMMEALFKLMSKVSRNLNKQSS